MRLYSGSSEQFIKDTTHNQTGLVFLVG